MTQESRVVKSIDFSFCNELCNVPELAGGWLLSKVSSPTLPLSQERCLGFPPTTHKVMAVLKIIHY